VVAQQNDLLSVLTGRGPGSDMESCAAFLSKNAPGRDPIPAWRLDHTGKGIMEAI